MKRFAIIALVGGFAAAIYAFLFGPSLWYLLGVALLLVSPLFFYENWNEEKKRKAATEATRKGAESTLRQHMGLVRSLVESGLFKAKKGLDLEGAVLRTVVHASHSAYSGYVLTARPDMRRVSVRDPKSFEPGFRQILSDLSAQHLTTPSSSLYLVVQSRNLFSVSYFLQIVLDTLQDGREISLIVGALDESFFDHYLMLE